MADFFDRLLARSVPGCPPPDGETAVRPRLPQLFERITEDVVRDEVAVADVRPADRQWPPVEPERPPPAGVRDDRDVAAVPASTQVIRNEVRTEERVSTTAPPLAAVPSPALAPEPHRVETPGESRTTRVEVHERERVAELVPRETGPVRGPDAPPAEPRHGPEPAARRAARDVPPQQVVRVTIGRVEVVARRPEPEPATRPKPTRPRPALDLPGFLARGDGRG